MANPRWGKPERGSLYWKALRNKDEYQRYLRWKQQWREDLRIKEDQLRADFV